YSDLVDFDDLILYAKALIGKRGAVKNEYDLIIVDEMQDTSLTEYSVIRPLFFGARVMMCGDDFQTIYGWRGSDPEKIKKDFISSFKAVEITLDGNRRSSPLLSYAGSYYLAKAFGYKNPDNRLIDGFDKIDIVACADEDAEAEEVFRRLSEYKGEPSGIAVMARSNRYIAELFRRLVRINASLGESERLGFFTADNDCQFYKKPVIKDFLAYLKITVNKYDFPSFERLAEKYLPSVGRGLLGAIRDYGKEGVSPSGFLCEDAYRYGDEYYSLIEAYKNNGIVVYDLETTGLDTENDDFLQISALKMGKDGEKGQMNIFVMPLAEISPEAIATHGYGKEELQKRGAVSAKTALIRFKEFAGGCVLIGHNSYAFDDNILFRTAKREGVELGLGERYDTLSIARLFRPDLADYKLSTICGEFGVVNERAHDAFSDVTATAAILKVLISDYLIPTAAARTAFMKKHSDKFRAFYENVKTLSAYIGQSRAFDAVKFIGGDCGVMKKHSSAADKESANDFYLALKEVLSGAKEGFSGVKDFVSAAALSGSQMDIVIKKLGKFPLITVHQSKGCEFESVILVGAGENEFPSYGAKVSGNEEEEKRVFYVALSRAKKKLTITYSETKNFGDKSYERLASPYLKYLPENCVEKSEAK
ncbi:MAG: UvrD-helicase domain-containing protein, partial [Clostridia bacterium]|nr:UvrD-helicase domain-containing protein [Clostridia bacterium]